MSQDEVYTLLKDRKVPLMSEEIAKKIGISKGSVTSCLKRLRRDATVEVITVREERGNANCKIKYRIKDRVIKNGKNKKA
jgi:Mn-dependent DtxR family transcriptional regulator